MKSRRLINGARIALLGAVNGLLFGSVVEALRRAYTPFYLEQDIQRALAEFQGNIGYRFTCIGDELPVMVSDIPQLCILVFAVTALLVHVRWKRPRSILLLWQVIGIIAATVTVALNNQVNYTCHHLYLLSLHWRLGLCLAIVVVINLLYGLFIVIGAGFYSQWKKVEQFR